MIIINLLFILLINFFYPLWDCSNNNFTEISGYKSSVIVEETDLDIILDAKFYGKFTPEEFNFNDNLDILNLHECIGLSKFVKEKITYHFNAPRVIKVIKADFLKLHKVISIEESLIESNAHIPLLFFAIEKKVKNIYKFGKFEGENQENIFGFMKDELISYNTIIRKEGLNIDNPNYALDIIKLYLVIDQFHVENILVDKEKILTFINKMIDNNKNDTIPKFENLLHNPYYSNSNKGFLLDFFTYKSDSKSIYFGHLKFQVSGEGEIEPKYYKRYFIDFLNCPSS